MSQRQVSNPALRTGKILMIALALVAMFCVWAMPAAAQDQDAPYYSPEQLDHLVSRVALYPDPLLAQVLAAATFPDEVPDAAHWADQHRYMHGGELADRIQDDQLPWDPSVQALLPFPNVLNSMASDMRWTTDLGDAFLSNQQEVMFAVQRMRQRARDYGYLHSGPEIVVANGPYITILPARPDYVVVPVYDPVVVYERPRPGFFIGAAIGFRFGVSLGVAYRPWGWGYNRIAWNERVVIVNNAPWHRTWVNRTVYVHPYGIRRVVVHDRGWNERHEAMEREREHWAHEHAERREDFRHEERREEHREAERREDRREDHHEAIRERQEEHHDAVRDRQEEHRDAIRDARRDDHRDDRHDMRRDDHPVREVHNDVGHVERRDDHPVREAHNDMGHVERRDVGQSDNHSHDNHGNGNGHGNDNHGNNGNHNGNGKDKDDKGHDHH